MNATETSLKSVLDLFQQLIFGNHHRAERYFQSTSGMHVYICAVSHLGLHELVKKLGQITNATQYIVDVEHFTGVYAEVNDMWFLIYVPRDEFICLGIESYNQSVDSAVTYELVQFGKNHNIKSFESIDFDVFVAMYETYSELMQKIFGLDANQIYRIKLINTYKAFFNNYKRLAGALPVSKKDHVGGFSWIYYIESQIIGMLAKDSPGLIIHDVACNTGNLPMLLSKLAENHMLPFNLEAICCSDYHEFIPAENIAVVQNALGYFRYSINVQKIDLRSDNPSLKQADVIIANDVLEHFDDDQSLNVFRNLWAHTKNLLIIHVPIEEKPNRFYGHFTNFNDKKLARWADGLDNCIDLTSDLLVTKNFPQDADLTGFLILKRKW